MDQQLHNWRQNHYEPSGVWQGMPTAIQGYKCRVCGQVVELPDSHEHKPPALGCTGKKEQVKLGWKCPNRKEEKARDYPAKKQKKS